MPNVAIGAVPKRSAGEKLIWMGETTPGGQRLYELDLVKPRPRGGAKSADGVEEEDDDADSDETPDDNP